MRHPSKVGSFCSRKGDQYLGSGGPPQTGKHLKRGPRPVLGYRVPWWQRLRFIAARERRLRARVAEIKAARAKAAQP